ncbi:MAG: PLDc N-terminal domain-containing protein [Candidatus Nanopelagicales bacterium]
MAKKQWSDFTKGQQRAIIVGATVEFIMTSIAIVDLVRRPASEIRGPRGLWLLGVWVQPIGPIAYLALGRKKP